MPMPRLSRRHFLYLGSTALVVGSDLFASRVRAAPLPTTFSRKLVNLTLQGGPDFRHLFVPRPETAAGTTTRKAVWRRVAPIA